ncbi:hypothetical protein PM082_007757 [Marasmius tenuissimus]|nr:hypothetical protein PM082_007757 [Marasmius tenuissimus]
MVPAPPDQSEEHRLLLYAKYPSSLVYFARCGQGTRQFSYMSCVFREFARTQHATTNSDPFCFRGINRLASRAPERPLVNETTNIAREINDTVSFSKHHLLVVAYSYFRDSFVCEFSQISIYCAVSGCGVTVIREAMHVYLGRSRSCKTIH